MWLMAFLIPSTLMFPRSNNEYLVLRRQTKRLGKEEGQITVFLGLLFFVMLGIGFLVFGGMREYFKKSLIDETFQQAGEDVLANYDRSLFDRYHLFFLDPRESSCAAEDANAVITKAFQSGGYFSGIQSKVSLDTKKSALEQDGKPVKEQIKKWEMYQGVYQLSDMINQLLKSTEKKESVDKALDGCVEEGSGKKPSDTATGGEEEAEEETEAEKQTKQNWKEWKKTLQDIMDSGILGYIVGDSGKISNLSIDTSATSLPSKELGVGGGIFNLDGLSLTKLSELKKLYKEGITVDKDNSLLAEDIYLIPYILDSFLHYGKSDEKKHCLQYEAEYLIAGKNKDKDNLKYVADQLFLMRFLVNYAYAVTSSEIRAEADSMAIVLSGILGFPEGKEIVTQLLTASLCYGESLLELRALFHGKKVALVKTKDNWNLTFANAISKLKSHADLNGTGQGVSYEQYLVGLLILKSGGKKVLCRMMDLMQCNVALDEPGFLLKNSLESFRFTGSFTWNSWIHKLIGLNMYWNKSYNVEYSRNFSYQ